jgi:hypothetical protein
LEKGFNLARKSSGYRLEESAENPDRELSQKAAEITKV